MTRCSVKGLVSLLHIFFCVEAKTIQAACKRLWPVKPTTSHVESSLVLRNQELDSSDRHRERATNGYLR